MKKRKHSRAEDPTRSFRKNAVWLFPGVFLIHSLFVYGAYQPLVRASLIAALASTGLGLASRWVRYATTLQALVIFLFAVLLLYTPGVVVPLAFLAVVERREMSGWVAAGSCSAMLAMLAWRFRASLRREWSLPLDESKGVVLYPHDHTLVRHPVDSHDQFLPITSVIMIISLVVLMLVARDNSWYLFVTMVVAPAFIAVLGSDLVARGAAFYWVTRRWEREHGVKLKLTRLR